MQSRVFGRFAAYQAVFAKCDVRATMFVYILQGGQPEVRAAIRRGMAILNGTRTIDTEDESERQELFATIRSVSAQTTLSN